MTSSRDERLERMLVEKRERLLRAIEPELGERLDEQESAADLESIEIGDRANASLRQDVAFGVLEVRRTELREVDAALLRLRRGDYGICESCEEPVEEERLEVLPFTALCVACKRLAEASAERVEATGRGFRTGFEDLPGDDDDDQGP